jgi:hypothetical protein
VMSVVVKWAMFVKKWQLICWPYSLCLYEMEPACKKKIIVVSCGSITETIHCSSNSENILLHCSGQNTCRLLFSKMTVPTCQTTLCLNFEDHSMFFYSILKLKFWTASIIFDIKQECFLIYDLTNWWSPFNCVIC